MIAEQLLRLVQVKQAIEDGRVGQQHADMIEGVYQWILGGRHATERGNSCASGDGGTAGDGPGDDCFCGNDGTRRVMR